MRVLETSKPLCVYEFGPFQLNASEGLLLGADGNVVPLMPKIFDTLLALVEQAGHVVNKNDLMQQLWPDAFVEESSLTQNISLLRRALAENDGQQQYIETIPKRGYRFVAPIRVILTDRASVGPNNQNDVDAFANSGVEERKATQIVIHAQQVVSEANYPDSTCAPQLRLSKPSKLRQSLVVVALGVLVGVAAYVYSAYWQRSRAEVEGIESIAVLPFKTIGPETEHELLGLGMADSVIIKLSQFDQTRVLPISSVIKYNNGDRNPLLIGRYLGVDAILDGAIQRDGDRTRVTAQLIRSSDGKTIWSGKFDEDYRNVFHLQDLVSESMVGSLAPQVTHAIRPRARLTENLDAYHDYLTGMYFWNIRTRENLPKAIHYLEGAVQKDPNFALAHAILADSYYLTFQPEYELLSRNESLPKAKHSAQRALDLDDNIPEAHVAKARVLMAESSFDEADHEFQRALEIDRNSVIGHLRYGCFLFSYRSQLSESLMHMKRAQELDPVSPIANSEYGYMLYMSRDYDNAIKFFKRALELQADVPNGRVHLAATYIQKQMYDEALVEFEKAYHDCPKKVMRDKAVLFGMWGRRAEALKSLGELNQVEGTADPVANATIYGAIGDKRKAFEWLERAELDAATIALIRYDPNMDSLRNDPRFSEYAKHHQADLVNSSAVSKN
jgi:DNA-binding winged helix-turn-helix (wHTH) protein/TolB-like protein/Tfp pilus assembly protein PilF